MDADRIVLKQAAHVLGKSQRQVMRDVKAGKLKATGGGRGVPFAFVKADVEAFKRQRSGVVNADVFARIVFASWVKRTSRADLKIAGEHERRRIAKELNERHRWLNLRDLWWCWSGGKYDKVDRLLQDCLPPLIPPKFLTWAHQCEQIFKPKEMDYLAAMFVVVEYPVAFPKKGERVLPRVFRLVKDNRPQLFPTPETLQQSPEEWGAIKESIVQEATATIAEFGHVHVDKMSALSDFIKPIVDGQIQQIQKLYYDPSNKDAALSLYNQHHPSRALFSTLLNAFHDGQPQDVRNLIEECPLWEVDRRPYKFPELMPVMEGLGAEAKMFKRFRDRQGEGKPSAAKIALVLGIKRSPAIRIFKRIAEKVGPEGMAFFANLLGLHSLPCSWRGKYCYKGKRRDRFSWAAKESVSRPQSVTTKPDVLRCPTSRKVKASPHPHAGNRPECPGCGEKVSSTATECPECGRLL